MPTVAFRSNKHLYVQVIDDTKMHTHSSFSFHQTETYLWGHRLHLWTYHCKYFLCTRLLNLGCKYWSSCCWCTWTWSLFLTISSFSTRVTKALFPWKSGNGPFLVSRQTKPNHSHCYKFFLVLIHHDTEKTVSVNITKCSRLQDTKRADSRGMKQKERHHPCNQNSHCIRRFCLVESKCLFWGYKIA